MTAPEPVLPGRRQVDAAMPRRYEASMRNDFLTPRGTPYKWQEVTAEVDRKVIGTATRTVVPVSYEWQRVASRTGTPDSSTESREWGFARGQSFRSILLHADVINDGDTATGQPALSAAAMIDVSYPTLPKAPAVDLLVVLSWDVQTFELMATQVLATRALHRIGGTAELRGISDTWATLTFSDPSAVASFRNAVFTAKHLGYGLVDGRATAVYSSQCLDCKLEYKAGAIAQRGRSSFLITMQLDVETGDLLCADMVEMIVATMTGADEKSVPVQKRRLVRIGLSRSDAAVRSAVTTEATVEPADQADLAEAVQMAERVAEYVRWQTVSLERLPQGAAELAMMGFRGTVGADSAGVYRQVRALRAGLQAVADGESGAATKVRSALAEHRRHLEGLLAFGQLAVDEAARLSVQDEPRRMALTYRIRSIEADLIKLLELIDRLEGRSA
jgi:hypothetical protein